MGLLRERTRHVSVRVGRKAFLVVALLSWLLRCISLSFYSKELGSRVLGSVQPVAGEKKHSR